MSSTSFFSFFALGYTAVRHPLLLLLLLGSIILACVGMPSRAPPSIYTGTWAGSRTLIGSTEPGCAAFESIQGSVKNDWMTLSRRNGQPLQIGIYNDVHVDGWFSGEHVVGDFSKGSFIGHEDTATCGYAVQLRRS